MSKSPDAFRTISEVADWLGVQAHVLRFWESKFTQIKPVKRAGGRRYYRPADMLLLGGIRKLLHQDGMSIKEVQAILRDLGISHVSQMSHDLEADGPPGDASASETSTNTAGFGTEAAPIAEVATTPQENFLQVESTESASPPSADEPMAGEQSLPATDPLSAQTPAPRSEAIETDVPAVSPADAAPQPAPIQPPVQASVPSALEQQQGEQQGEAQTAPPTSDSQTSQTLADGFAGDQPAATAPSASPVSATPTPNPDQAPAPAADQATDTPEQMYMELDAPQPGAPVPASDAPASPVTNVDAPVADAPDTVAPAAADLPATEPTPEVATTPLDQSQVDQSQSHPAFDTGAQDQEPQGESTAHEDPQGETAVNIPQDTGAQQADPAVSLAGTSLPETPAEPAMQSEPDLILAQDNTGLATEPEAAVAEPDATSSAQDMPLGAETPHQMEKESDSPPEGGTPSSSPTDANLGPVSTAATAPRVIDIADEDPAAQNALSPGILALLSKTKTLPTHLHADIANCAAQLRALTA
ncbi:MerR family regulatory protein [Phaeobacter sp. CECT 5382]|uniref:MerR family transcriptional regulator n=1 Tax=Phaeobacter sp. CECT 5382 TaxID=1712645 RepID=UPI0006DAC3EA|nr:MerR family transcriptional regulator [Phaeobacter sp. CECT 5382]CUH89027.1 MerR family regulatory protein [Phaeobacter sp. CECT 5382]